MIADERERFDTAWLQAVQLTASQAGRTLDDDGLGLAFSVLADFELAEVEHAIARHLRASKWSPTIADIVALIEGELPGVDALIALAMDREHPTTLGVIVRRIVGEHALTTGDGVAVARAVRGKLAQIDGFRRRALVGDFTEDELRRIVAAGCAPSGEIAPGVTGCRAPFRAPLQQKCRALHAEKKLAGPADAAPIEGVVPDLSDTERAASDAKRREMMAGLGVGPADPAREAERATSIRHDEGRASA